jgi:exopolyphosphatase/guanosine-5'-triphosphate,3'-diphosphate pyrophosphatase
MAAANAPVQVAHGYALSGREARSFAEEILAMPDASLAALPGLATRRAPTLRSSALVLDRVLKHLSPERVVFSALGVREGWLYRQLPEAERYADPLLEGAQALGSPTARVPGFAAALAHWTDGLFPAETPSERRLRLAACALSDIAWRDHGELRAQESFRRVLQFPFIGLDHPERAFLAATLHSRYVGSADDPLVAPALALMSRNVRRRALILGRVMLLGYRFSGSVPGILASAHLRIENGAARLLLAEGARVPDSEVVQDRLNLVAAALGLARAEIGGIEAVA